MATPFSPGSNPATCVMRKVASRRGGALDVDGWPTAVLVFFVSGLVGEKLERWKGGCLPSIVPYRTVPPYGVRYLGSGLPNEIDLVRDSSYPVSKSNSTVRRTEYRTEFITEYGVLYCTCVAPCNYSVTYTGRIVWENDGKDIRTPATASHQRERLAPIGRRKRRRTRAKKKKRKRVFLSSSERPGNRRMIQSSNSGLR